MSLWGEIVGGATGFLTGGVGGAIAGWQAGGRGPVALPSNMPTLPSPRTVIPTMAGAGAGGGFNMPFPVNGPGGVPLPGFNPGGTVAPQGGACPRGYHLNKHALAATKGHPAVPAHSICVRNRSVNPLNHRALTRSLKRLKRAGKLVRKLHVANTGQRRISSGGHKPGCGCFRCRRK